MVSSSSSIVHYNFRIGYVNFSSPDREISFIYVIQPFNGWNPVYAGPVNYSLVDVPNNLLTILIHQTSWSNSSNPSNVPFTLNYVSLTSPQGFYGKIETWNSVTSTSLIVTVNQPGALPIQ